MEKQSKKNITHENYYQDTEYLTNSMLSALDESPLDLKVYLENCVKGEEEKKDYFVFGELYHMSILQPDKFKDRVMVQPIADGRTTEGKKIKAEHIAMVEERTRKEGVSIYSITHPDYNTIIAMRDVVYSSPGIMNLLEGKHEVIKTWEIDGIKCKGMVDCENEEIDALVDLKTTLNLKSFHINQAMVEYGYIRQASWYCKGFGYNKFIFIFQKKTYPYSVAIHGYNNIAKNFGIQPFKDLLLKYRNFLSGNCNLFNEYFV